MRLKTDVYKFTAEEASLQRFLDGGRSKLGPSEDSRFWKATTNSRNFATIGIALYNNIRTAVCHTLRTSYQYSLALLQSASELSQMTYTWLIYGKVIFLGDSRGSLALSKTVSIAACLNLMQFGHRRPLSEAYYPGPGRRSTAVWLTLGKHGSPGHTITNRVLFRQSRDFR